MFKLSICLFVLVASGVSDAGVVPVPVDTPTTEKREIVPLISFQTDKHPDGSFKFSYEGGDQSYRTEEGVLTDGGTEDEALEVSGSYRYIDDLGQLVEVHYTAGKNGFVPVGTNILPEISAVAKAAADLPKYSEEEERAERFNQRRARAKAEDEQPAEKVTTPAPAASAAPAAPAASAAPKAAEPAVAAAELVPVKVVQEQPKAAAEQVEKTKKVESKSA